MFPVHIQRTAAVKTTMWHFKEKEEEDQDITHGCCWLYTPRIKNIERKKNTRGVFGWRQH
jgi:Pyruvate/2-oxoacid:ferredoxin oxidoreductase delta subunit